MYNEDVGFPLLGGLLRFRNRVDENPNKRPVRRVSHLVVLADVCDPFSEVGAEREPHTFDALLKRDAQRLDGVSPRVEHPAEIPCANGKGRTRRAGKYAPGDVEFTREGCRIGLA